MKRRNGVPLLVAIPALMVAGVIFFIADFDLERIVIFAVTLGSAFVVLIVGGMSVYTLLEYQLLYLIERLFIGRLFIERLIKMKNKTRITRPPGFFLLRIVQFFYSRKTVEEVIKPIHADWLFEYYECLKEDRVWQARWTSFRWMVRFIFAMGLTQAIAFLRDFVPFGSAKN